MLFITGFRDIFGPHSQTYPPNWLDTERELDGMSWQERLAFIRRNVSATVQVICPLMGGSGVIVGPRHVLTAGHLTSWGPPFLIRLRQMNEDGLTVISTRLVPVRVVARGKRADVAILKILPWCDDLPEALPLTESWTPIKEASVWHFGITTGWSYGRIMDEKPRREGKWYGYDNLLYSATCKCRQGDSGGPVITRDGEIVGLVAAGREAGLPLLLFIPADEIRAYLPKKHLVEFDGGK